MIVYDLRCDAGHEFEAWFKNLKSFERQRKRNLIECPLCGSLSVALVYQASSIPRQALRKDSPPPAGLIQEKVRKFLEQHFEDVGTSFPEEARRVHHGEAEPRNLRGQATEDEEESLRTEGVPVFRIALPKPSH